MSVHLNLLFFAMQRIQALLQKLDRVSGRPTLHVLDIDIMLDDVRALYDELLDKRDALLLKKDIAVTENVKPVQELPVEATEPIPEVEIVKEEIRSSEAVEWPVPVEPVVIEEARPEPLTPTPVSHYYTTAKDIRTFISINDKYQFINELFRNDKDAYEQTLSEINGLEGEEQAMEYLNFSVVDAYDWNDSNDTVQMFYKVLNEFFARK